MCSIVDVYAGFSAFHGDQISKEEVMSRTTLMASYRKDDGSLLTTATASIYCCDMGHITWEEKERTAKEDLDNHRQKDIQERRVSWSGVHRVAGDRCRGRSLVAQ